MLAQRIITGIIGIIVTVYVVNFGGWAFGAAIIMLSLVAWYEYCEAFANKEIMLAKYIGYPSIALFIMCVWQGNSDEYFGVLLFGVLMMLAKAVFDHAKFSIQQACISVCGLVYIALPFSHLLLLRFAEGKIVLTPFGDLSAGCAFIWLAFIGTWASDTFAFFVGSTIGKTKLCPEISPKKSREGFVGGMVGTVLALVGMGMLFSFSMVHMIILGVLIAVAGTIGDLVESLFKRYTGIKDSGQILPGHGGVLDRFDSIMFTVPVVYYYIKIFPVYF